jgi:eukaryotic-like serine/threonine-protein kinase
MLSMSLQPGSKLGPYEVQGLLGAGAMGEVYRAHDTRLRRDVAMKVLGGAFANDSDRLRRFEQEARAAGALNHPNILAIHDMGRHGESSYVVSELLEGSTLRERLGPGPLPVRRAVETALQIARGLAAAHEKGIVHRDLKPDNLFVTRDGAVKILDFGLAKLTPGPIASLTANDVSQAPTQPGTVLGTVGYMSPEQVGGQSVDHRSDIFSFGAILYEMVTGRKAFRGRTAVETMSAILKDQPPQVTDVNPEIPPALERIVGHCLEKSPDDRFQSTRDLVFDLEALSQTSSPSGRALARAHWRRGLWKRLGVGTAAVALPVVGFLAGRSVDPPVPTFERVTFQRGVIGGARLAPDGQILYTAAWDGQPADVYTTRAESPQARPLGLARATVMAATRGEMVVILGRDGAPPVLATVPLAGGPPREILEGAVWADATADGARFAVVRKGDGPKLRVEFPIGTLLHGTEQSVTDLRISPDEKHVAFIEHPVPGDDRGRVMVVSTSGEARALSSEYASAQGLAWRPDGREVWLTAAKVGAESALYAVALDGKERLVTRTPGRLVLYDIGPDGKVLLQRMGVRMETRLRVAGEPERDFAWLDHMAPVAFTADGSQLLFYESGEGGGAGYTVYLRRTDGSPPLRLGAGRATALSPDGRWAVSLPLDAPARLVLLPTGAGEARTFRHEQIEGYVWAGFFPDGKRLLVSATEKGKGTRAFQLDIEKGQLQPLPIEGIAWARDGMISPGTGEIVAVLKNEEKPMFFSPETGQSRELPGFEKGDYPVGFSGDGKTFYVRRPGRGETKVFRIDLASGRRESWQEVSIADRAGVAGIGFFLPMPDGKGYVFAYRRALSDLYVVGGLS